MRWNDSTLGLIGLGGGILILTLMTEGVRNQTPTVSEGFADGDMGRTPEEMASIRAAADSTLASADLEGAAKVFPPAPTVVTIPVHFHIFYKADGTGLAGKRSNGSVYPIEERVADQVKQLNAGFSGREAQAAKYSNSEDARLNFVLDGIEYVQDDHSFDTCDPLTMMKGHSITPDRVVNVFSCTRTMVIGQAAMPGTMMCSDGEAWTKACKQMVKAPNTHYSYAIAIDSNVLPGGSSSGSFTGLTLGDVLTHEMGHFLGLLHPYQDSCVGGLSPNLSDFISDTPRIRGNVRLGCGKNLKDTWSCPQDRKFYKKADYLANYMVATYDACRSHFTRGQVEFIHNSIAINKNFF